MGKKGAEMLNPLEMAIATEYAIREQRRREQTRGRGKNTKTKWALLFWFLGFGFMI